jgi:two-component system OmpR family sensor kinase
LRTLLPFLIVTPVLLLLVANLVRKMFRPIAVLAAEIDQRAEQDLQPVNQDHLPVEVRPFIVAINRLLKRVAKSMEGQRRFVADAAHELRSPLTAMSLQAERLADADMSAPARDSLATLRQGIARGRNLLDQLLTLAKVQAMPDLPGSPISVQAIYRRVLEDLLPMAQAKDIDIGVEGDQDALVMMSELDLTAVVKNLVDNAIRYTPIGGKVDLSITRKSRLATLQIKDSGPGIPAGERMRVFDAFYRSLGSNESGSGLGLSIVKTIADRVGAEIWLSDANEKAPSGLCVSATIPIAEPPGGD